jgi:hypothetical protein
LAPRHALSKIAQLEFRPCVKQFGVAHGKSPHCNALGVIFAWHNEAVNATMRRCRKFGR